MNDTEGTEALKRWVRESLMNSLLPLDDVLNNCARALAASFQNASRVSDIVWKVVCLAAS
jgi:hypothetical protein